MFKVERVKNKHWKRVIEHSFYLLAEFVLIPLYYYFEVVIVLPSIVEEWSVSYIMHLSFATFLLMNIVGNLIYGTFTNSSIVGRILSSKENVEWSLCTVCECLRPPRAWHCDMCNVCVLKRDHHCPYLTSCVGYFNQRYFMWFLFYMFVATVYAFYFNVQFLAKFVTWNYGLILIKFIFPLACLVFDCGAETFYVILFMINILVAVFSGALSCFHFYNVFRGRTSPEIKHGVYSYNYGWKLNLVEVFGKKWYLTWISPFIRSPLPGNGVDWVEMHKHE